MYWFRTGTAFSFIPWLVCGLLWGLGGWLLVGVLFNAERRERVLLGLGVGITLYLWMINLAARLFTPDLAFLLPAILVLAGGGLAYFLKKPVGLNISDLNIWPELAAMLMLSIFFTLISRGLGIFDEPKNLSLISLMARGEIPPKYYLDGQLEHAYHYGSQLLGASLMRLGGLFPWSAFDISKGLYWGYLMVLVFVFLKRHLRQTWKAVAGTAIFPFLSGTRYLLAILPAQVMQQINPLIEFEGVSTDLNANLAQSLNMTWTIAGGPPGGYPFAYLNSFHQPFIMAHAGTWTYAFVLVLLLWMLSEKIKHPAGLGILAVLLSMLALVWESTYVVLAAAIGISFLFDLIKSPKLVFSSTKNWLFFALLISVPLAFFQGGVLYSFAGKIFAMLSGTVSQVANPVGRGSSLFSIRWPPGIFSNHFGALLMTQPLQMLVALFEMGPIILFVPMITCELYKNRGNSSNLGKIIALSALIAFILPIFVSYDRSPRDITRFTNYATSVWNLGLILVFFSLTTKKYLQKIMLSTVIFLCTLSGLVLGYSQLDSISHPILADGIDGLDARILTTSWDNLEKTAFILDPGRYSWRATMITGRYTQAAHFYSTLVEYEELKKAPDIKKILDSGFRYLYVDELWWRFLGNEYKPQFSQACIHEIAFSEDSSEGKFRRLLDLSECSSL